MAMSGMTEFSCLRAGQRCALLVLVLAGVVGAFNPLSPLHREPERAGSSIERKPEVVKTAWFPMSKKDLDQISKQTLEAGADLDSNHPGFRDQLYRQRRQLIVENARKFSDGDILPNVDYTHDEVETWGIVYKTLRTTASKHAVSTFNEILEDMEMHSGYGPQRIPQLQEVSEYLQQKTGFTLRPVGGLLTPRDFLNGLAFKCFHSTQYIRHKSKPFYTPEPDVLHELVGHAPMLADPDFADLSHQIGIASLGASDEEITRLARIYWFSVEFGLCLEDGKRKAYGAGLLSSMGELEYSCADIVCSSEDLEIGENSPSFRAWEPAHAAMQEYPITHYQPTYYIAESLSDAKSKIRKYCSEMERPFSIEYDINTDTIKKNV